MKRYGRKQKQAARQHILALERRLFNESSAHLYRRKGLKFEAETQVLSYCVTEDGAAGNIIRFSATLVVRDIDPDIAWNKELVTFMGRSYIITSIETPVGRAGPLTLELEAIA